MEGGTDGEEFDSAFAAALKSRVEVYGVEENTVGEMEEKILDNARESQRLLHPLAEAPTRVKTYSTELNLIRDEMELVAGVARRYLRDEEPHVRGIDNPRGIKVAYDFLARTEIELLKAKKKCESVPDGSSEVIDRAMDEMENMRKKLVAVKQFLNPVANGDAKKVLQLLRAYDR